MELLIAFFIAVGLISNDVKISNSEVLSIQAEYHDKLSAAYGEKYTSIIIDESEKD
jgi:hypothetical protein